MDAESVLRRSRSDKPRAGGRRDVAYLFVGQNLGQISTLGPAKEKNVYAVRAYVSIIIIGFVCAFVGLLIGFVVEMI